MNASHLSFFEDAVLYALAELHEDTGGRAFTESQIVRQLHIEDDVLVDEDDVRESLLKLERAGLVERAGPARWESLGGTPPDDVRVAVARRSVPA